MVMQTHGALPCFRAFSRRNRAPLLLMRRRQLLLRTVHQVRAARTQAAVRVRRGRRRRPAQRAMARTRTHARPPPPLFSAKARRRPSGRIAERVRTGTVVRTAWTEEQPACFKEGRRGGGQGRRPGHHRLGFQCRRHRRRRFSTVAIMGAGGRPFPMVAATIECAEEESEERREEDFSLFFFQALFILVFVTHEGSENPAGFDDNARGQEGWRLGRV